MLETGKIIKEMNFQPQKKEDADVLDDKRIGVRREKVQGEFADFLKEHFKVGETEKDNEDEGVFV